jgi:CheY-like chemotaxis protein
VLVLDCALPKLSGWNVAANVRRAEAAMPGLPRAVLIGYTGYAEQAEEFIRESDFKLFDRVAIKPAEPAEILGLVERAAKGECLD